MCMRRIQTYIKHIREVQRRGFITQKQVSKNKEDKKKKNENKNKKKEEKTKKKHKKKK